MDGSESQKSEKLIPQTSAGADFPSNNGFKKLLENKGLLIILIALCAVMVVLFGFVIAGMNHGDGEVVIEETSEEEDEYSETNATPEELEAYDIYMEKYEMVRAEARELLNAESVDAVAIMSLYEKYIDEYVENGAYDYVQGFVLAENEDLMSAGLKQDALNALTRIDYSMFPANIQHRRYKQIISLAQELGDSEVVAKYEPLAAATEEAFAQSDAVIMESSGKYQGGTLVQGGEE